MVTLISDIWGIIQLVLTIGIMVVLLSSILFLDYLRKGQDKRILNILIAFFLSFIGFLQIIAIIDIVLLGSLIEIVLQALTLLYTMILIWMILLVGFNKKYNRNAFLVILGLIFLLIIVDSVIIWIQGTAYNSLHIGSIFGVPALFLVSIGTLLVIFNENKFVMYHGYTAGSAWLFTLLNVIFLFTLTADIMKAYSGWIHAFHIICGGVGLTFGFTSALFGLSGQRKLAKVTGYTTLGCWWTAYLLSIFIQIM